jgi:hypothetical protein
MKWGYKYEDGDIVLNEKNEGNELTEQGLEIWAKQERSEYYSDFGYDRGFLGMQTGEQRTQIRNKLDSDLEMQSNTEASYEFVSTNSEILDIKINFKNNA